MAYINGEFKHKYHDITIEVLEPRRGESDYKDGLRINVEWDNIRTLSLAEFRIVLAWMLQKADFIEKSFTKQGKIKTIVTEDN